MPSVSGLKILFSLAPLELTHGAFQNDRKTSDSNLDRKILSSFKNFRN